MKKNKHAKSVSFWTSRLALLLLLLIVAVAYVFVGTFAKYTSSSEGSDTARVARFAVSAQFTGTEQNRIINCTDPTIKNQTGSTLKANSLCVFPISMTNTQVIGGDTYIAETSQQVDIQIVTDRAIHEIFGLEMSLIYPAGSSYFDESDPRYATGGEVLYDGTPTVDAEGRYVFTFPNVAQFPVQKVGDSLLEQSSSCELHFFLTSDAIQPITGMQLFVSAVGIQLD